MMACRETPFVCTVDDADLLGILSMPTMETPATPSRDGTTDLGVLILNAGMNHRVGPHRLHVRIARDLARSGIPAARFDFSGLGDSAMRPGLQDLASARAEEIEAVIAHLRELGLRRFLLIGLCAGGGAAFRASGEQEDVVGAALLNTRRFDDDLGAQEQWRATTETRSDARFYWKVALFRAASWKRLFTGRSSLGRILRASLFRLREKCFPDRTLRKARQRILQGLEDRHARGVHLLFLVSEADTSADQMRFLFRDHTPQGHSLVMLQDTDHTFTWRSSQDRLTEEVVRWAKGFRDPVS